MQAYGRKFVGTSQIRDYAIADKLGEGTFGEVHKASHIVSKRVVALKRILMHNEKEGVPVTALREIKILKMLSHPSVVTVCDMVVEVGSSSFHLSTRDRKGSIYMVFPYMDHDLAGLLENPSVKFSPSQIKLYMRQLLEGTEYLHQNKIHHRDLKAANLLINNQGSLQIADFGLARPYSSAMPGWDPLTDASEGPWEKLKGGSLRGGGGARYTNCVVTHWYRPPELLMGEARYGWAIDLWGVGCIMGEMWTRRPILCGNSDPDQLEKIWELCGTPDEEVWPGWRELPGMDGLMGEGSTPMDEHGVDLVSKLLTLNPATRTTAFEALDHDCFWTEPLPCDPSSLPKYTSSHEYDKRKLKGEAIAPQMSMACFSGPHIPGPGLGPGPSYPLPPQQMPSHPPMMHGPAGFRPPGPWGGPGTSPSPSGPAFNQHMSRLGGRGGGRGGFVRGGGRGFHPHHQQRPIQGPISTPVPVLAMGQARLSISADTFGPVRKTHSVREEAA
ncbi:Pkinase-domain-containing protein [Ceratobasidium sp. AG-I]|nr:Pkinase-domain-containing protein [Ceratobasidium sp. AG-I]